MLIHKDKFVGLENITHLATGGESPMLRSHRDAFEQFMADKSQGEAGRHLLEHTYARVKALAATLLGVSTDEVTFLAHATEGINLLRYALDWQAGDNVVVCDVEFPSDVMPWSGLVEAGIDIRVVKGRDWRIHLDDVASQVDKRTRVVATSYVSYFTGQRQPLAQLSKLVRASNALLLLDVTHAAGVVPVDARLADIVVSSCYKWMLGTHGSALFYCNHERLPNLPVPFLGWNSAVGTPLWDEPIQFVLKENADRFLPGNPSFVSLYILENALNHLLEVGSNTIEEYVLELSGMLHAGLTKQGWNVITPAEAEARAGNICFTAPDINSIAQALHEQGIWIWGGYGGSDRARVSTHLYNNEDDVSRLLDAIEKLKKN